MADDQKNKDAEEATVEFEFEHLDQIFDEGAPGLGDEWLIAGTGCGSGSK
jgi:hypothetical protein